MFIREENTISNETRSRHVPNVDTHLHEVKSFNIIKPRPPIQGGVFALGTDLGSDLNLKKKNHYFIETLTEKISKYQITT